MHLLRPCWHNDKGNKSLEISAYVDFTFDLYTDTSCGYSGSTTTDTASGSTGFIYVVFDAWMKTNMETAPCSIVHHSFFSLCPLTTDYRSRETQTVRNEKLVLRYFSGGVKTKFFGNRFIFLLFFHFHYFCCFYFCLQLLLHVNFYFYW